MEIESDAPLDPLPTESPQASARSQFSLRSLLAGVAVAAVLLAVVGREIRNGLRQEELVNHFLACGATIVGGPGRWQLSTDVWAIDFHARTTDADTMPLGPGDIALLAEFEHLESLSLAEIPNVRQLIPAVGQLRGLASLDLAHTNVADEDLGELTALTGLREIHLQNTDTTYEVIDRLQAALPELQIWDD